MASMGNTAVRCNLPELLRCGTKRHFAAGAQMAAFGKLGRTKTLNFVETS